MARVATFVAIAASYLSAASGAPIKNLSRATFRIDPKQSAQRVVFGIQVSHHANYFTSTRVIQAHNVSDISANDAFIAKVALSRERIFWSWPVSIDTRRDARHALEAAEQQQRIAKGKVKLFGGEGVPESNFTKYRRLGSALMNARKKLLSAWQHKEALPTTRSGRKKMRAAAGGIERQISRLSTCIQELEKELGPSQKQYDDVRTAVRDAFYLAEQAVISAIRARQWEQAKAVFGHAAQAGTQEFRFWVRDLNDSKALPTPPDVVLQAYAGAGDAKGAVAFRDEVIKTLENQRSETSKKFMASMRIRSKDGDWATHLETKVQELPKDLRTRFSDEPDPKKKLQILALMISTDTNPTLRMVATGIGHWSRREFDLALNYFKVAHALASDVLHERDLVEGLILYSIQAGEERRGLGERIRAAISTPTGVEPSTRRQSVREWIRSTIPVQPNKAPPPLPSRQSNE